MSVYEDWLPKLSAADYDHPTIVEANRLLLDDAKNYDDQFTLYVRSDLLNQVTDQLWVGAGTYDLSEHLEVVSKGVTHVIDCRHETKSHGQWKKFKEVKYLWTGFYDDGRPKTTNTFAAGIRFGLEALADGGVVYAHCAAGMNRGPSMAYALLRAHYRLRPTAAFKAIQAVRPCAGIIYAADVERALIDLGYERS